jgi:hypothetical protein
MVNEMNHFQLRINHRNKSYRAAMHSFALFFPLWGVFLPVTLGLFVLLLLRLPANLHWFYALEIILGLAGTTALCAFLALVCDDDCLRVTQDGIQFPLRFAASLRGKLFHKWDELAALKLRWGGSSNFAPNEFLGLVFKNGGAVRINLLDFEKEDLQQLFGAIKNCGKNCDFDPEFTLLARASLSNASVNNAPREKANSQPSLFGEFSLKYGAQSTVARWFSDYWTPQDRMLAPWLFVAILGAFIFYGPQLLLFLVGFLPMAQLGNSGASLLAHRTLLACSAVATLWIAFVLLQPLLKPTQLIISPEGIQKIWDRGIEMRGSLLPWKDVIAIYVLSRSHIHDKCRIVFATAKNARAFSIQNAEIPDEESKALLAVALRSVAGTASLAPDVFDVLTPCRTLSLADIWDLTISECAAEETALITSSSTSSAGSSSSNAGSPTSSAGSSIDSE